LGSFSLENSFEWLKSGYSSLELPDDGLWGPMACEFSLKIETDFTKKVFHLEE
jgi:hypothetical protein